MQLGGRPGCVLWFSFLLFFWGVGGGYEFNIGIASIDDRLRLMVGFGVKLQWVVGCKMGSSMKWCHRLTYTIVW